MQDFTQLTIVAGHIGMVPYKDRMGHIEPGIYTLEGYYAPVDLSECVLSEKEMLKEIVKQLSEDKDESFHQGIERDLAD